MHGLGRLQGDSWEGAQVGPENREGTREGTAGHSRCDFLPLSRIWSPACTRVALGTPDPTQEGENRPHPPASQLTAQSSSWPLSAQ